jgi:hypothetical protein
VSRPLSEQDMASITRENNAAREYLEILRMDMTRPPAHLTDAVTNVDLLSAEVRRLKTLEGKQS